MLKFQLARQASIRLKLQSSLYLMIIFYLAGCSGGSPASVIPPLTSLSAVTATPTAVPIITPSVLPTSTIRVAPSASPSALLGRHLLFRVENTVSEEVWITTYPFSNVRPLLREDGFLYGQPIWSYDGQWLAFARTAAGCPASESSIWVSRGDGSEARQVSESVQGKINPNTGDCSQTLIYPASPRAWSADSKWLAVDMFGPHILSIETGQSIPIYPKADLELAGLTSDFVVSHLSWNSFAPDGHRALLVTFDEAASEDSPTIPILIWTTFDKPSTAQVLKPPPEFTFAYPVTGKSNAWSPDGRFLLVADRTDNDNRLWKITVDTDQWEIIASRPFMPTVTKADEFSNVSWSPDGQWIAWWSRTSFSKEAEYEILFLDSESWSTVRNVATLSIKSGGKLGDWVVTAPGESRFTIWDNRSGAGLFLLNPLSEEDDLLLIEYDFLVEQMPQIDFVTPGPWRP